MATIVLRANTPAGLTNAQLDANFTNLNNDKVETSYLANTFSGTTNITTLGNISAGTWNGSTIAVARGGTGTTTSTGSGSVVLSNSPSLVTPTLGVATATSINKVTITAPATGSTLTIADGKTLTASNTLTLTGTDGSSIAFGNGGTVAYASNNLGAFGATTSAQLASIITDETGGGKLVFATSPTFTTSIATDSTTFSVANTTATTVSAFGAATAITIGATTGTTNIKHSLDVDGNVNVDGGSITTGAASFNIINTTATAVNAFGAATAIEIGAATGTTNINHNLDVDGDINIDGGDLTVSGTTFNLANNNASTVNAFGDAKTISIGSAAAPLGTTTVNHNLVVTGDLTVNGSTVTVNTTEISVDDINIELGKVATPTDTTANGGGIILKGATDKTILWDSTNSNWTSSEHLNIATGKSFKINNTSVLSSTTLGSTVTSSSLNKLGLTTAGFVKTDSSGNLSVDTNTYLTTATGFYWADQSVQSSSSTTTTPTFGGVTLDNGANRSISVGTSVADTQGRTLTISAGSAGTSASTARVGGDLILRAGTSTGTNAAAGALDIDSGVSTGTGASLVKVGTTNATAVSIGRAGVTTTVAGSLTASLSSSQVIKFDTGATEGTDLYTFNGGDNKTINIKAGTNITLTKAAGAITISANDPSVDWSEIQNKPDPVITVTLTGDVTGTANATLTDLASGTVSITTTIAADAVALGTDTTGNYVASVATTSPLSGGATGSEGTAITLSLADGYGDTKNPYASKTAKHFLAAPNGADGAPSFRAIVTSDLPTLYWANQTVQSSSSTTTTPTFGGVTLDGSADRTVAVATATNDTAGKNLTIDAGDAGASATAARTGGTLTLLSGNGSGSATAGGTGGQISIISGAGTAGTTTTGASGAIAIRSNSAPASGIAGATGAVSIYSGVAAYNGSATAANSGNILVYSGLSYYGNTGSVIINSGNALIGNSGNVQIYAGESNSATASGAISITGGAAVATSGGIGGTVTLRGGASSSTSGTAQGGSVYISGGIASSTQTNTKLAGSVYIDGGGAGASSGTTYGQIFIGTQANGATYATSAITIGKAGTALKIIGTGGAAAGFFKSDASGNVSIDTNTYLTTATGFYWANQSVQSASSTTTTPTFATVTLDNGADRTISVATAVSDGAGRALSISAGNAGASATAVRTGGALNIAGGAGTGTAALGGDGGAISITSGAGSNGTTTGGASGAVTIRSGNAGTGGNANAGTVTVDTGTRTGTGTAQINIGTTNAVAISIGRTGVTTTVNGTLSASLSGNASTASKLQTAVNINGTSFDGSAAITTSSWGTSRNITIGSTAKAVDGSAAVSWSLADIGAAASDHSHTSLGNLATVGTITTGIWQATDVGLAHGGTGASLTAADGGIVYSTSSALAIADITGVVYANATGAPTSASASDIGAIVDSRYAQIGTTTPSSNYLYLVRSDANATLYVRQGSTGDIAKFYQSATAGATSGTSQVTITNTGGITATGVVATSAGSVAAPSLTFSGDTNTGFYNTADKVFVTAGGANAAYFGATEQFNYGNIYITTADDVAADATTTFRDSGALYFRTKYWNGSASANVDWNIIGDATAAGATTNQLLFRVGTTTKMTLSNAGALTVVDNITAYSDIRHKTDIMRIENALEKVQALNGYTYNRIETGARQTGVIAQEVQQVLPEAVVVADNDEKTLSVAYGNMVGLLIEAIKEQQKQIDDLKAQVSQLKSSV